MAESLDAHPVSSVVLPPLGSAGISQSRAVLLEVFRESFANVPMPVAIATSFDGTAPVATTVSSLVSVSLEPLLLSIALARGSNTLRVIRATGRFGVNVLGEGQEELARACAQKDGPKLAGHRWRAEDNVPRLERVARWFRCDVYSLLAAGDHVIVLGLVVAAARGEGEALMHYRRTFLVAGS